MDGCEVVGGERQKWFELPSAKKKRWKAEIASSGKWEEIRMVKEMDASENLECKFIFVGWKSRKETAGDMVVETRRVEKKKKAGTATLKASTGRTGKTWSVGSLVFRNS